MSLRNVLRLVGLAVVFCLVSGGVGTLAGVLVSLPFNGFTRAVVWAVVGGAVAGGVGCLVERRARR